MKEHGATIVLCFLVLGFLALVALNDYAWTSWAAYQQVEEWELLMVVAVVLLMLLASGVLHIVDLCQSALYRLKNRNKKR